MSYMEDEEYIGNAIPYNDEDGTYTVDDTRDIGAGLPITVGMADNPNVMRPFLVNPKLNTGWHFPPGMLFRITEICKGKEYGDTIYAEEVESVLLSFMEYLDEK